MPNCPVKRAKKLMLCTIWHRCVGAVNIFKKPAKYDYWSGATQLLARRLAVRQGQDRLLPGTPRLSWHKVILFLTLFLSLGWRSIKNLD
jgi:hypothetical protein